ncbi:hypothetical protein O0L34_g16531 [Tuta absoluta]|nr:hypothetical protein O0L34_g16531 [Tuta absoluta]
MAGVVTTRTSLIDTVKCQGPHEYYSCGGACDNVCATLSQQNQTNCPIINIKCNEKCYCEKQYARDSNGVCIPISSCPPSCNGDPNAEPGCCGQTCANYDPKKTPICNKHCTKDACQCKKGYVLDEVSGKCVLPKNCLCDPQPVQNRTSDEAALQTLSQGVNIFCFKFFQQALKAKSGQNVIMSPWSVQIPLAQLAIAAESETLKQLLASLNLANKDQIRQAFPLLLDTLKGSDGVTFDKAVRLYINDEFPLLEEYIAISEKVFNATAENVNCRDSTGTANKINKDVESVTNNRIKNLISPDVINDLTRLILVNAIYFKGTWKKQFNVNNTKEQNFYTYDKRTVPVQMMNIETTLEYTKDNTLNAQIVRLTYTDEEYSLVVILPNEKYGFDKTASSLNAETVKAALGNLYKTKVNLYLPKMEINADFELIPILQNLGIVDIFDAAKSNLKGILKIFEPLYVTAAKQKAFFQANEQGTEAAAATAFVVGVTSVQLPPPEKPVVRCDHPFLFIIYIKNSPVFIGAHLSDK